MVEVVTVEDIADWDYELEFLTGGLGWLFNRPEPRTTFSLMVRALLADVPKKNSWGLAEYAGLATPQPFEHLLAGASWDVDALREAVAAYVVDGLADRDGVLVLDDTQVIKKGVKCVGAAAQHSGLTGQTENCQVMVMLSYASVHGHAFIDRELYLPASWTDDRTRCARAGVPAERGFVTKPHLGIAMLARALAGQVRFRWFVADSGYGRDPQLRQFCHTRSVSYVMAVPVDLPLVGVRGEALRPDTTLAQAATTNWERRSCGDGAKGARYFDWTSHTVTVKNQDPAPGFSHTLLTRRSTTLKVTKKHPHGVYEIEHFLVHSPTGTLRGSICEPGTGRGRGGLCRTCCRLRCSSAGQRR